MPDYLVSPTKSAAIAAALRSHQPDTNSLTQRYLQENRDREPVVAILFLGALVSLILGLRCYGRLFVQKKFGIDDWLAVITIIPYSAFIALCLVLIRLGSGRHIEYIEYVISNETTNTTQILDFAAHMLYTTALFTSRLSGLAFYRRIGDRHRWIIRIIDGAVIFLILAFTPQIALLVAHCKPVTGLWPYAWQAESTNYKCLTWGQVYVTNSGLSLVCDMVIFAIPIAIIMTIKRSLAGKIRLSLLLFPGILVIGISSVRIYLVVKGQWNTDQSWAYDPLLAVENAEIAGTMLALCVPALKPLCGTLAIWVQGSKIASSYFSTRSFHTPKSDNFVKMEGWQYADDGGEGGYHGHYGDEQKRSGALSPEESVMQSKGIMKRMDVHLKVEDSPRLSLEPAITIRSHHRH